jgi:hypothetical protein
VDVDSFSFCYHVEEVAVIVDYRDPGVTPKKATRDVRDVAHQAMRIPNIIS